MDDETRCRLAALTDPGAFERLATAVLREAEPTYEALVHTGVNKAGKTVRAPLDGVAFVPGVDPPHMVAVHHTTCSRRELERKWLGGTDASEGRNRGPAAQSGDLPKTAAILAEERARTPSMRGTLVLTTNEEPPGDLVRNVEAAARAADMGLDLWPASRLAHFLDFNPQGQWIRRHFLGIAEERLSGGLLRELARRSLELFRPPDDPSAWVGRDVDRMLGRLSRRGAVFVVGESGLGKSIACFKRVADHVERGGYGLIVPHDVVEAAISLDEAVGETLQRLHPSLVEGVGSEALALGLAASRLILVVEDVNKSERPAFLLEKIASWQRRLEAESAQWQLFCPVWPDVIRQLREQERRRVEALSVSVGALSPAEGAAAVRRRRALAGDRVTRLEAEHASAALGHDPLLIALYDPQDAPEPEGVVGEFIHGRVERLAASARSYTATDYLEAMVDLASRMLEQRDLDPAWTSVREWFAAVPETVTILRALVQAGDVLRLTGTPPSEHVGFRHDRVRDWLLVEACARQLQAADPPAQVVAEPYFAEILGAALARGGVAQPVVERIARENPLALFHALRGFREAQCDTHRSVLLALEGLVGGEALQGRANETLRWASSKALAETDSPHVVGLVEHFPEQTGWYCLRARFRNGDFDGGVGLCWQLEPGVRSVGHIELIEHVRAQHGSELIAWLGVLLRQTEVPREVRVGGLRLAGHLADPALREAIEASWLSDGTREENLDEYLWACAQCCGDDPARFVGPVCDAWALLPDEAEEAHRRSPRNEVAAYSVRWGFQQFPPRQAIPYLIERAKGEELSWQILYLLHGVDDPEAVEFVTRELAAMSERVEESEGFSPFVSHAPEVWRQVSEAGRPMSDASRARLQELWEAKGGGKHLRMQAFRLWVVVEREGDLRLLRDIPPDDSLFELALRERICRHDKDALPELLQRLEGDRTGYWWQLGRSFWSEELTDLLDHELSCRRPGDGEWGDASDLDWMTSELVMRLPERVADRLLRKHWAKLRTCPRFVKAALYVATPQLGELVAEALAECPAPKEMLRFLGLQFGVRVMGHPGISRAAQIEAVVPYLDHLEPLDVRRFWDVCNERGWFELRRAHLDRRVSGDGRIAGFVDEEQAMAALDEFATEGSRYRIDHWLRDFLGTGASAESVVSRVTRWLHRRPDIVALDIAARAVVQIGRRADLSALGAVKVEPADEAADILADASFSVRRRSLV